METGSTKPDYAFCLALAYWTEVEIIFILGIADRDGLREIIKRSRNSKKANELKFGILHRTPKVVDTFRIKKNRQ